tara:strand:- start:2529 stop:3731 length:1203 start_codon:yes stop_codon:yes gene_type:complete
VLESTNASSQSWLPTPPGATWPTSEEPASNPYIKWRKFLWSWHYATDKGWTDEDYVSLVTEIDTAISTIDGSGFRITPTGTWVGASDALPNFCLWKDETNNVAGSHKARHLMGVLLHLAVNATDTDKRLAISSCGNAALGAATVARAVSRPIDVFIPTWASPNIVNQLENLDATIHVCDRKVGELGDPCMNQFQEAIKKGSLPFSVQASENILALDGGRTLGWELAEVISSNAIDHLFIQVGGGALLTSCTIGLLEAKEFGILETVPKVCAVQAEGCAPFDKAWKGLPQGMPGQEKVDYAISNAATLMSPWEEPESLATGILDDVTYDWIGVVKALAHTGGESIVASEKEISMAYDLVNLYGVNAEPTGSAGLAGVMSAVKSGYLQRSDRVGVLLTGVLR